MRKKGSRRRVSSDVSHTYLIPSYIIHPNMKFSKKTFFPRRTKSDKKKLNITYGGEKSSLELEIKINGQNPLIIFP